MMIMPIYRIKQHHQLLIIFQKEPQRINQNCQVCLKKATRLWGGVIPNPRNKTNTVNCKISRLYAKNLWRVT